MRAAVHCDSIADRNLLNDPCPAPVGSLKEITDLRVEQSAALCYYSGELVFGNSACRAQGILPPHRISVHRITVVTTNRKTSSPSIQCLHELAGPIGFFTKPDYHSRSVLEDRFHSSNLLGTLCIISLIDA